MHKFVAVLFGLFLYVMNLIILPVVLKDVVMLAMLYSLLHLVLSIRSFKSPRPYNIVPFH